LLGLTVEVRFERKKNNALWRVDYLDFVRLDNHIGLFWLFDKKRKQIYRTDN